MRVLILAPRVPYPADYGAAQRNFNLLRWIGARHEVTLVAFGDPADAEVGRVLREHAARVEVVPPPRRSTLDRVGDLLVSGEPDLARRLWSPELVARLGAVLKPKPFDVVQLEGLEVASAWAAVAATREVTATRVILDDHNAEYVLQASAARVSRRRGSVPGALYSLIQARRLRRYERNVARAMDGVVTVSPEDEAAIRALDPGVRTAVVANGVDTQHYQAGARSTDGATALFIGKLDYRPNVDAVAWLADEVWPGVRAAKPSARLLLVGRDPTPAVARVGDRPGIEVIGPVGDERPLFDRADLLLVPMRMGGGVRLKVLQAMAMRVPVVATRQGVAGIPVVDGIHYLRGETASELARRVVQVFDDAALADALRVAARRLVCEQFDWQVILPRLDAFYETILGASRVRPA